MLIEQPRQLVEKLFLRIKACFIARDKGCYGWSFGEVRPNWENDFLSKRVAAPPLGRIMPSTVAVSRRLHETSPSP
jgi:hypothetical protein